MLTLIHARLRLASSRETPLTTFSKNLNILAYPLGVTRSPIGFYLKELPGNIRNITWGGYLGCIKPTHRFSTEPGETDVTDTGAIN